MKLLLENWRGYEQQILWEHEFEQILNEELLCEFSVGSMWSAIKTKLANFSAWGKEKLESFVKLTLKKIKQFVDKIYQLKKIKKIAHRKIARVLSIMSKSKYIKVVAGLGLALSKWLLPTPERIENFLEAMELVISDNMPEALKKILGISDFKEYAELVGGMKDFGADVQATATRFGENIR